VPLSERMVISVSASVVPTTRDWTGIRVVVTGASGFIGPHLVRRLTDLGANLQAVSRRPQPRSGRADWHVTDLADADECAELIGAIAAPMWCSTWQGGHRGSGHRPGNSVDGGESSRCCEPAHSSIEVDARCEDSVCRIA
jgi:NAD(P)-dependent dehydrogenase (short-subunit alcohol dehydrogenase family)